MNGLLQIALKLLANDRGKFFTLIVGITFAVVLMLMMTSLFSGIMQRTAAVIYNVGANMWVMDPSVNTQTDNIPMPNFMLDYVRSIKGVKFAVPLYSGSGLIKFPDGRYQPTTVIGIDDSTLYGRPNMLQGEIVNLYNDDAYIAVKDSEFIKLDNPVIGDTFELNENRGVFMGIGEALMSGLFGTPTIYTTYNRALSDLPQMPFTITYILVEPKSTNDINHIQQKVSELGYLALTKQEFVTKNTNYYLYQTGLGTNVMIMTLISFIVGLSIAGQTFYAFVIENIEEFGALKAIGAKRSELIYMILFQASIVGFIGYGFGMLIAMVLIALAKYRLANYAALVTFESLGFTFLMVLVIVAVSSYLGIRRVIKIDPFTIFRGG